MSLSPDIILELQATAASLGCYLAIATLYVYDCAITIDAEVEHIWRRKLNWGTVLFIVNRYTSLLAIVLQIFQILFPYSLMTCKVTGNFVGALNIVSFSVLPIFSCMRVWALSHHLSSQRYLSTFVFLLGCVPVAANLYYNIFFEYAISPLPMPYGGCSPQSTLSNRTLLILGVSTRACSLLCDAIVVAVTTAEALKGYRGWKKIGRCSELYTILLRDGVIFFGTLLILNMLQIVTDLIQSNFTWIILGTIVSYTNQLMTNGLISRLILNLRSSAKVDETVSAAMSTVGFNIEKTSCNSALGSADTSQSSTNSADLERL